MLTTAQFAVYKNCLEFMIVLLHCVYSCMCTKGCIVIDEGINFSFNVLLTLDHFCKVLHETCSLYRCTMPSLIIHVHVFLFRIVMFPYLFHEIMLYFLFVLCLF